MKRLREEIDSADACQRFEATLLAEARQWQPSTQMKQRVRSAINDRQPTTRPRARRIGRLMLLGAGLALAAGALIREVLRDRGAAMTPRELRTPAPGSQQVTPRSAGGSSPPARPAQDPMPPRPSPPAASSATSRGASSERPRQRGLPRPRRTVAPEAMTAPAPAVSLPEPKETAQPVRPAESIEAQAVIDAKNYLRRDGDPARAKMMLQYYLRRYPDGAIAEEALALSIEAALALHDRAEAAVLARRYLDHYPQGGFAGVARLAAAPAGERD